MTPGSLPTTVAEKIPVRNASGLLRRMSATATTTPRSSTRHDDRSCPRARRPRVAHDEAGVSQSDDVSSKPIPTAEPREARAEWRARCVPQRRRRDDQEEHSGPEDDAQCRLPRHVILDNDGTAKNAFSPIPGATANGRRA